MISSMGRQLKLVVMSSVRVVVLLRVRFFFLGVMSAREACEGCSGTRYRGGVRAGGSERNEVRGSFGRPSVPRKKRSTRTSAPPHRRAFSLPFSAVL